MLEVTEFSSDFQSVKHKYNQTDLVDYSGW